MAFCHIYFNESVCDGCGVCVEVCMSDVFAPNPEKGKPPLVRYPEECWFCGCCITDCPHGDEGAIKIITPFPMRGSFKRS
ncbi:MAG: ferredoxin family protein [Deltaproteobacteria bacterium]|nr:ferredoxin family protein [Deltaproteobacteria bacterium]MBW2015995.1 ferredoxin family protein [Deltaproteobacteria bacterium]MBW2128939.1 ferredoxin family protein [Deltaproteobacteria bacterium]MBW2303441.1 ferredoxin family protein [Deltaproteobacteria bacterium]